MKKSVMIACVIAYLATINAAIWLTGSTLTFITFALPSLCILAWIAMYFLSERNTRRLTAAFEERDLRAAGYRVLRDASSECGSFAYAFSNTGRLWFLAAAFAFRITLQATGDRRVAERVSYRILWKLNPITSIFRSTERSKAMFHECLSLIPGGFDDRVKLGIDGQSRLDLIYRKVRA